MTDRPNRSGYRGYVASRPVLGERAPQHVQNLVVREYARKNGLTFLLSAAEYAMPGCHMILEQVLDELPKLQGVIFYSLFMLPEDPARRARVWDTILDSGATFHAALEEIKVTDRAGVRRVEDIWLAKTLLPLCPGSPDPSSV